MRAALAALFVVGACGGDNDLDPVVFVDAAVPDVSIDAPPGPLVGEWRTFDPLLLDEQKNILTLRANGGLSLARPDHTFQGSWDILPDTRLHLMLSTLYEAGFYYVSADRLLTGVLRPSGPVDGLVGTWISHDNFGDLDNVATLVTNADLTMTLSLAGSNAEDYTGTYAFDGARFVMSTDSGDVFYFKAIPGVGIGQDLYERVP